jgi:hypothetical protein
MFAIRSGNGPPMEDFASKLRPTLFACLPNPTPPPRSEIHFGPLLCRRKRHRRPRALSRLTPLPRAPASYALRHQRIGDLLTFVLLDVLDVYGEFSDRESNLVELLLYGTGSESAINVRLDLQA